MNFKLNRDILNSPFIPIIIFTSLASGLGIAYYAEYVLAKEPCILCIYTRYAFMVSIVISMAAIFIPQLKSILMLSLFATLSVSAFHMGVEQQWWKGPDACHASVVNTQGLSHVEAMAKLRESLKVKKPVRCDAVNWEIYGVSATILNTFYIFIILILSGVHLWPSRYPKK